MLLESRALRRQADRVAKGVAQKTVTLADLKSFSVYCPPLELQQAFAARAAKIDRLKAAGLDHLAKIDALSSSLQYRAFRGELISAAPLRESAEFEAAAG
jgi:type I restriction enzyme S subunit